MNAGQFWREVPAFRAFNKSKDLSPKTITLYDHALRQFYEWITHTQGEDAEISARRVREFMAYRLEKGNSRATVRSYIGALRTFFGFLVMDEVISQDEDPMPSIKSPRVPRPQIQPLTSEQIHHLLDSFDRDTPTHYRDYVICCLILDTGLRIGEIARLSMDDLNLDDPSLRVDGKGRKPRLVYMGHKMRELLVEYMEDCRPVIGNGRHALFPPSPRSEHPRLQVEYLSQIIRDRMDDAGIPRARSSAHRLRHTFAVNFLRAGGGVFHLQRLLGHASLTMTRRYVILADNDLAEAHRRYSPLDRIAL